jgi:hypothetical protein
MTRDEAHQWHVAVNRFHNAAGKRLEHRKWMYEAKDMMQEVPRLALLFKMERTDALGSIHQQCSHSEPQPVPANHLTCCLGVKCRECPELKGLDAMEAPPEAIDEAKAWTCATHIAFEGGDFMNEGYLLTVDDRMFWDRVHSSLSQATNGSRLQAQSAARSKA